MHPETLAFQVRNHQDALLREAAAARLAAAAKAAFNPHVDESRAFDLRRNLRLIADRLATA